jgi:tetratricopeptide (TPR) repeat protein
VILMAAATAMRLACGGGQPRTAPGQLQPGSAEFLANEGIGYLNEGRLDVAADRLEAALKKNPRLVPALNGMALVHVYRREFPKAVDLLNRLLQVSPKFHDAYNLLGTVYSEMGDYEQAKEKLLIAANAEEYQTPENSFANLAMLEIKFGKHESALRYAEKGLQLNRRFAPLFNLKGLALENLNRLPEAAESFIRALALLPAPEPLILVNSARVAARLGEKKKALDQLEQALGRTQDAALKAEIIRMIREVEGR